MASDIDLGIEGLSDYVEIGSGGFATVYSALEADVGRRVAVKVLGAIDDAARRRFDRERRTMGQTTDHPNIVTLFRSGYTAQDVRPYLVMEHMAGGSLQDRIDARGLLDRNDAVDLIMPIADALGYSHRAGIVHKDVKPANILLSSTGAVKLTDFGIAAIKEATVTSQVAYSLAYTPPETFSARRDPATGQLADPRDERSDLYSLAATLYALLTGTPPFQNDVHAGLMNQILTEAVPMIGDPGLDSFMSTALAKDPDQRYPDADEFIAQLRHAGGKQSTDKLSAVATELAPGVGEHPATRFDGTTDQEGGHGSASPQHDSLGIHDQATVAAVTSRSRADEAGSTDRRWWVLSLAGVIVALLGVGGVLLTQLRDQTDDNGETSTALTSTTVTETPSTTTASPDGFENAALSTSEVKTLDAACPAEEGSAQRQTVFDEPPPLCIDLTSTYVATFTTSLGQFQVLLDPAAAPNTVNNFVFLARHRYYDGSTFHRVIPGFVIQGGDPNGDPPGTGGPGYTIAEEPPQPGAYQVGSFAMAKKAEANTTGGQFFIVTGPDGESLPNTYSLFGQVTDGFDVVAAIEDAPTTELDAPLDEITIESVVIQEG